MGMRVRVVAAAVVVALVGIGACSRGGDGDDAGGESAVKNMLPADRAASRVEPTSEGMTVAGATAGGASSAAASGDGGGSVADTDAPAGAPLPQGIGAPKVIKTAVIEIEVADGRFDAAFSRVPSIAAALGGFVSSSTSSRRPKGTTMSIDRPRGPRS